MAGAFEENTLIGPPAKSRCEWRFARWWAEFEPVVWFDTSRRRICGTFFERYVYFKTGQD